MANFTEVLSRFKESSSIKTTLTVLRMFLLVELYCTCKSDEHTLQG